MTSFASFRTGIANVSSEARLVAPANSLPGDNRAGVRSVCTILAGPNGSGKSSIYKALSPPGLFINADIVARHMNPSNPESVSFSAGKSVLRQLAEVIQLQEDFVYETTLSSHQSIKLIQRASKAGYEIGLIFVVLRDSDLNVARVAQRVSEGGHNIPEAVIRRRYDSSLVRLGDAIRLAGGTVIYDNSSILGPKLLLQIANDAIEVNSLDKSKPLHVRMAAIVGEALGIGHDAVFRTPAGHGGS